MSDRPATGDPGRGDAGRGDLHPLVEGFADAHRYDRGRPRYGHETVTLLMEELGLEAGMPVLDLGAGTGQLSRALLEAGLDVTAVDPLGPTRELLAEAIGAQRVHAGVAEEIPLPDSCVQAVFAADSFHWFDESRAMPEIRRVLRPGGGVAILRSFPIIDAPWSAELGTIMMADRLDHPIYSSERTAAAALEDDPAFGAVRARTTRSERTVDRDGLLAYFSTISWIAAMDDARREPMLARAADLLERHDVTELRHPVEHQIWLARLRD